MSILASGLERRVAIELVIDRTHSLPQDLLHLRDEQQRKYLVAMSYLFKEWALYHYDVMGVKVSTKWRKYK